jgi:putative flippase GtrA
LKILTDIIDIFYPPFKRLMPLQTFRYAACGGGNMLLGLSIYFVLVKFVFTSNVNVLNLLVLKSHNAALFVSGFSTFCIGFLLNKFVVFTTSYLRGRIQLFRYFLSFFTNLVINYFLLKFFVENLKLDAFVAQLITTAFIVTLSYITQKHFTFKQS